MESNGTNGRMGPWLSEKAVEGVAMDTGQPPWVEAPPCCSEVSCCRAVLQPAHERLGLQEWVWMRPKDMAGLKTPAYRDGTVEPIAVGQRFSLPMNGLAFRRDWMHPKGMAGRMTPACRSGCTFAIPMR